MGNMISYVKEYGHLSFAQKPFCEVDSLVLAQISYFVMDGYVSGRHRFSTSVRGIGYVENENVTQATTLPKENAQLLEAVKDTERFGALTMGCYKSVTKPESALQFAAVTFRISPQLHYIAFRGTDTTLVGWKEDFNLAYSENIPSQLAAAQYLKQTARYMRGDLILGGHSKGGHLAVYAAMYAPPGIQNRIQTIYNHDGPGFLPQMFESGAYKSIRDRVKKTVPHSAIVGMLLGNPGAYTVVASRYFPLLQHNPFTWEIKGDGFVRLKKVDFFSALTNQTLQDWLLQMDIETRKKFVDALFDILQSTNAETYPELIETLKKDFKPMRDKLKSLEPETRAMLQRVLRALVKCAAAQLKLLLKKGLEKQE